MKNAFLSLLMFTGVAAFAQNFISPNLTRAIKDNPFKVKDSISLPSSDLSFYSRNYFEVFGYEQYTFDKIAFGNKVYISSDNRFYHNGAQNLPDALPADPLLSYYDYQTDGAAAVMGAAVLGVGTFAAISNIMNGTKDYSPKVDRAAFEAAGRGE